ncbi:MAG: OPT family oligopeptide transporter [Burkholderiaceae bacterium]
MNERNEQRIERGATLRAVLTGMAIGALLTPCNVYSGLKIGWSFNMSIASALLALAFWRLAQDLSGARPWSLHENVVNQTAASSAASIISGGLVAPIPALSLLTGTDLATGELMLWVFSVSALGIVVAVVLRAPMVERDGPAFPAGVATAETVREIHAHGKEAAARVRVLVGGALVAGSLKLFGELGGFVLRWTPSVSWPATGALRDAGVASVGLRQLGIGFEPSLLMIGFGAIIGLRAGLSLLLGALLAWLVIAPRLLASGAVAPGDPDGFWFGPLVEWLLWPGVTLMTVASLSLFVQAMLARRRRRQPPAPRGGRAGQGGSTGQEGDVGRVGRTRRLIGTLLAFGLAVHVQNALFDISLPLAVLAVLLAFVLAVVAARVVGETGIAPIGAIGKLAQLSFGVAAPANPTMNLMGANVTGGAAGQCADLLNDLRAGHLLGTSVNLQLLAQCLGVLTGSVVGVLAYRLLIPDPRAMLLTPQWPAPAVATWKAVAEVLAAGVDALPASVGPAVAIAALAGLALSLAPRMLGAAAARWIPSGAAIGLAFVIPAGISIAIALGAVLAAIVQRVASGWATRFVLALAAGLVAGESLAGIGAALAAMARG